LQPSHAEAYAALAQASTEVIDADLDLVLLG
jgi:hypothetical protein